MFILLFITGKGELFYTSKNVHQYVTEIICNSAHM